MGSQYYLRAHVRAKAFSKDMLPPMRKPLPGFACPIVRVLTRPINIVPTDSSDCHPPFTPYSPRPVVEDLLLGALT